MKSKIKVLIIDDHQIFRDGISSMFNEEDDIVVIGFASDGEEALKQIDQLDPDILLLDISLPGITGFELMRVVNKKYPGIKILVLSMHTKAEYIYEAMNAGAFGYLPKQNTSKYELLNAVRTVYMGEKYLNEDVTMVMKKSHSAKGIMSAEFQRNISSLTKREHEIVRLVAEGLTNQEIANKLFVNIRTVETHKTNILQKLHCKNSVDLVKFAIKNNLLEL
jgi:DNA-binding NarL/FixJ family response regulator